MDNGSNDDGDLALAALHAARRRSRPGRARRGEQTPRGGVCGAGPAAREATRRSEVMASLLHTHGWERSVTEARVFADWTSLVGRDVAAHCEPVALADGELRIAAQSTAWATQLRMLGASLLGRLAAELGPTVVTRLHITGPVAPSWKHGPRSIRGRGPRDTYG